MSVLARLAIGLGIIGFTLLCALPWGASGNYRLALPLLPYALIHHLIERSDDAVPDWLVFVAGFTMDVAGQGPLGFWALIYLCGYTVARSAGHGRSGGALPALSTFLVAILAVGLMQWSVASVYELRTVEIAPHVVAVAFTSAAYLVIRLAWPSPPVERPRANARLERGA